MGEVINLIEHKEHLAGPAICTACKHEWAAAVPIGETTLECPACNRYFGVLKAPIGPKEVWECRCGNDLYFLTPEGARCRCCGVIENSWAE